MENNTDRRKIITAQYTKSSYGLIKKILIMWHLYLFIQPVFLKTLWNTALLFC